MKTKTTTIMILTFLLANIFAGALTSSATTVSAESGSVEVQATLGRYRIYNSDDYFEDSFSGNVTGYLRSRYDISPQENVEIGNASIVLESPFAPGNFTDIYSNPHVECTPVLNTGSGNWTYAWNFSTLSPEQPGAMVSLPTIFQEEFDPGFAGQRIWDPWITSNSLTQTLTIEFTPLTIDFHNVHVSVQIPNTTEVSPSIDPDSVSASPMKDERDLNWTMWSQADGDIEVNWGGDPELGITYTFSVDVTVENILFPEPVFYKPSVGFGANFNSSWPYTDAPPKIGDDIDRDGDVESSVTYYGTGAFTWKEYAQSEHSLSLPWCSFGFHEIYTKAEGSAFVRLEDGIFRGSSILGINKGSNIHSVKLEVAGELEFWWDVTDYNARGNVIMLTCEPAQTPPSGIPRPTPIDVTIARFEEAGRVAAFGRGIKFTGKIIEINWPPP